MLTSYVESLIYIKSNCKCKQGGAYAALWDRLNIIQQHWTCFILQKYCLLLDQIDNISSIEKELFAERLELSAPYYNVIIEFRL